MTSQLFQFHLVCCAVISWSLKSRNFIVQCTEVHFASFLSGSIYHCHSIESTGKETGKMHLCVQWCNGRNIDSIGLRILGGHSTTTYVDQILVWLMKYCTCLIYIVHIFWESHKILWNLHVTFDTQSKVRWIFRKIKWPSQNMWTLKNKM